MTEDAYTTATTTNTTEQNRQHKKKKDETRLRERFIIPGRAVKHANNRPEREKKKKRYESKAGEKK